MLGAIIGDIAGSRFEFDNYLKKDFVFFTEDCYPTDDSIMTIAVAKAIMETDKLLGEKARMSGAYRDLLAAQAVLYMREIGRNYPGCGYGGLFSNWMFSDEPTPYKSFGNGAAMRVSPAGYAARTEREAKALSEAVTSVTHSHREGIRGAEAVSVAVFMARMGYAKEEIREKINNEYYPMEFTIDELRPGFWFDETCQGTVPPAIQCFLESESFEDAVRIAVSLGGDSDTIACIAGAIAGAFYGVPDTLRDKALSFLDRDLRVIYAEWMSVYKL